VLLDIHEAGGVEAGWYCLGLCASLQGGKLLRAFVVVTLNQ